MSAARPSRPADDRRVEPGGDPDLAAVCAAQADRAAFEVIYRRYLDRVYSYAFYQLGDHHDAEDVTERVFMAALAALPGFREQGASFRAWLFGIAHNTIANVHRSRARRKVQPLAEDFDRAAPGADPAIILDLAEDRHRVLRAVSSLAEDRRQVILLRFVDGLTTREIGEVLERSPGAVRVLQHRALRDLAELLGA